MEKNYRAELVGCFGDPVDGNPTGVMEEAAFTACGLNYRYITAKVCAGDLPAAFAGIKAMNFCGINLTMPHKIDIIPLLDGLSASAAIIGAVNTVVNRGGKWIGENSDGKGFVESLRQQGCTLQGKYITILGAGGAARAIGIECALAGAASITIINRSETRGQELVELIRKNTSAQARYAPWTPAVRIPKETQVLVNATCIGFDQDRAQAPDIDYTAITTGMYVSDVVFNPVDPLFLQKARAQGAKTISGLGMLAQQGAINFTLWTGKPAPLDVMVQMLEKSFS